MELLLLLEAFASVLVLLASAAGVFIWVSMQVAKSMAQRFGNEASSGRRPTSRPASQWDPGHPLFSKRAGQ